MSKAARESLFTGAYLAAGLVASLVVGYLTFKQGFFHLPRPMLPFIVVGVTGSLIYAAVQMRGAGIALLMILLLLLIQLATTPPLRAASFAASAIFAIPVGFAFLAGSHAQKALSRIKVGRFVLMAVTVAAGYGLMMLLWLIRSHVEVRGNLILRQALVGLELGAAMGFGFELVDLIGPRPKPKLDHTRPVV